MHKKMFTPRLKYSDRVFSSPVPRGGGRILPGGKDSQEYTITPR